jgi:hypothetical protein
MGLDPDQVHKEFAERLSAMLDLVAKGRGIELLIRIADQTNEGMQRVVRSYDQMLTSEIGVPSLHPPQALPKLVSNPEERKRIELARDIADKVAHGLFRTARKLIDRYRQVYGLTTEPTDTPLRGWSIDAKGHLIHGDGRRIESVVDMIRSTNKNLIVEEFDVFKHNHYDKAAEEIFADAWRRIFEGERSLAMNAAWLQVFRGMKRGEVTYSETSE